jgi:hypothetical protein
MWSRVLELSYGERSSLTARRRSTSFTISIDEYQVHVLVHVLVLKLMDGIRVMTRKELEGKGIQI